MILNEKKLKNILLEEKYISEENADKAEKFAQEHENTSFKDYLLYKEILTKDLLGQAIAEFYNINYFDLGDNPPNSEIFNIIPLEKLKDLRVIPVEENKKSVTVTTDNPDRSELEQKIKEYVGSKKVQIVYSLTSEIEELFKSHEKGLQKIIQEILRENETGIAPKIFSAILKKTTDKKASDIHYEPKIKKKSIVKMRIDGVLQKVAEIPKQYHSKIINYIKVSANLRIDEKQKPQDGSIKHVFKDDKEDIDIRVSIAPTMKGEKVVLRLLAEHMKDFTLNGLGLSTRNKNLLKKNGKKPFGMILVTGPTSSGKTTSLYSLVKHINEVSKNVTTIEDPVEYRIDDVNQIQVKPQIGLTFANGLRTILRQDPDVVLLGEIRDKESSEIAVNSALTGHLMMSTFHANDAPTSIPRLIDMGVEPYLLSSTLELVVSQRLVRKICSNCRHSKIVSKKDITDKYNEAVADYFDKDELNLYESDGCKMCHDTGYNGRTGIFEFLNITNEMESLIMEKPSKQEIWSLANDQGSKSLFYDGIEKAKEGITDIKEVIRVASPNNY